MYEFTQDCLTGIGQIDEEHRKLFSLINEAAGLPKEDLHHITNAPQIIALKF